MVIVELVSLTVLILFAVGSLVYWSVVAFHVLRTMRTIPTARAGLTMPAAAPGQAPPRVCVIMPAHNEAECIGEAASSLARQDYPNYECVFVLDRCTDNTREVLVNAWKRGRASRGDGGQGPATPDEPEIIELDHCPPGWAGKPHGLHTAVTTSRSAREADLLLFIDADTWSEPGLIRATVALLQARDLGMLSLLSTLSCDRWFERLLQPAASMELLRQYPIVRANADKQRRAFANGQFILIRRSAYDLIGGHEAVREVVLEDVEIARRCEWHDVRAGLLLADGLLWCRMYESYPAFRRGWKRIFTESANRKPRRIRRTSRRVRLIGALVPVMSVVAVAVGLARLDGPHPEAATLAAVFGGLGAAAFLTVIAWSNALARTPVWAALGFPAGSWLVGGIMNEAARDLETGRPTEWAGMAYQRAAR